MNAAGLTGDFTVPFFGALLWVMPAVTRPTVQFGVRVPGERAGTTVIRRERRAYYERTAAITVGCTVAAVLLRGYGSWWLSRIILLLEMAADVGCFLIARKKITAAKNAGDWFAGLRQTVVADTSWRTDPPRFPVLWLMPALAVAAATGIIGLLRYPGLPAHLAVAFGGPGRGAAKSAFSVFGVVAGQAYVTILWTGLMLIVYRSRPDLEAADAAASSRRYRRFLAAWTRALLTLVAMVNLTLLLAALQSWQVYRLSGIGSAVPLLPLMFGLLGLVVVMVRVGQGGHRLAGGGRSRGPGLAVAGVVDRDDDRFWKAGLFYVNRDDPAIMVASRFGVGWTFNFANRMAWLVIGGMVTVPAGLALILRAATM